MWYIIAGIIGMLVGLFPAYLCGFWDGRLDGIEDSAKEFSKSIRAGKFEVKGRKFLIDEVLPWPGPKKSRCSNGGGKDCTE